METALTLFATGLLFDHLVRLMTGEFSKPLTGYRSSMAFLRFFIFISCQFMKWVRGFHRMFALPRHPCADASSNTRTIMITVSFKRIEIFKTFLIAFRKRATYRTAPLFSLRIMATR